MTEEYDGDLAHEGSDHQTAYIFAPKAELGIDHDRPTKRRRESKHAVDEGDIEGERLYFPTLLGGAESEECIRLRQRLYKDNWAFVDSQIQAILEDANEKTLNEVEHFLGVQLNAKRETTSIPTGLIVTGPNIASQDLLFSQLAGRMRDKTNAIVVNLRSGDATNLKAVLKKLIRDATDEEHDDEDERQPTSGNDAQKLLNYDLQILHNYLGSDPNRQVVVAFQDSEAFDSNLLTDLILLFRSWLDRIHFAVLFGVATSVELFHERLPRSAITCLRGAQFDVEDTTTTLEKIFEVVVMGPNAPLRFGPNFLGSLLERQQDHVQSLQAFVAALKYAYMTHFYANPLSIFLTSPGEDDAQNSRLNLAQQEHREALRMLPSVKAGIESHLKSGDVEMVRYLLQDNMEEDGIILDTIEQCRHRESKLLSQLTKLKVLSTVVSFVAPSSVEGPMDLYLKFMSESIEGATIMHDLVDACKRLSPSAAGQLLTILDDALASIEKSHSGVNGVANWGDNATFRRHITSLHRRILDIIATEEDSNTMIRSIYTQQAQTMQTSVVGQRVHLSKKNSVLTPHDATFTKTIDDLVHAVTTYFKFSSPYQPTHELWIYDARSPYREVFTPRPRHAVERALSTPHDYINCGGGGLSSSQPPTAILYQLYLETGGLINVFDLWSAFSTILSGDNADEDDERKSLMLFYQALADLKTIGAVKTSRRKTDHLSKLAWKGL